MELLKLRSVLLLLAVSFPVLLISQTREPGTSQVQDPEQPSAGAASYTAPSYANDALSTSMSGSQVFLDSGDLVETAVFDTPELSQTVRVDSNGKLMLALIGEIDVRGMSPAALEKLIRSRLIEGHFVRDPQVSVFVSEYAGQMSYVSGEVNRPGGYPLLRSHRLSDLIAVAGGMTARAGNTVTITHQGNSVPPTVIDITDKDENQRNPEIAPGDSVTVGLAGIVYVLGDVGRPGGFVLDRRGTLSASQAVALAEGILPSASLRKAQLVRTTDGTRQEIPLDLKLILKAQSPDPQLQAGDILYIPQSTFRGLGRQSVQTLLSGSLSGVAVYSAYHF
jgi:polysaccharide export outer membrane protein